MLRVLGKLRSLFSGVRHDLRREEMDGAHYATLADRPFVGCQPCAPAPQPDAPQPDAAQPDTRQPNPPAAQRPTPKDG